MMRILYTSTTGMRQSENGLDVIGNNLANVNTVGFKRSAVHFSDLMSQTVSMARAAQGAKQVGLGVGLAAINPVFTQGSAQVTGSTLDMMLNGDGMFIVKGPAAGGTEGIRYTRAGHFALDSGVTDAASGTPQNATTGELLYHLTDPTYSTPVSLVDSTSGYIVQGWLADATGTITTGANVVDIQFDSGVRTLAAAASTRVALAGNLDANATDRYTLISSSATAADATVPVLSDLTGQPAAREAGTYRLATAADGSYRLTYVPDDNSPQLLSSDVVSALGGASTAGRIGTYTVVTQNDGSAVVTFTDGVNPPEVTNFAAGTVSAGTVSGLIPGVSLTFGNTLAGTTAVQVSGTTTTGAPGVITAGSTNYALIDGVALTFGADIAGTSVIDTTGSATAGEHLIPTPVYDANGIAYRLETRVNHLGQNRWGYHMRVADEQTFTAQGTAGGETFTLRHAPEPGTVEIYVGASSTPLASSRFAINGSQIVPVDTDNDAVTDSPAMTAGQSVRIAYKLAESASTGHRGTIEFDADGQLDGLYDTAGAAVVSPFTATFGGAAFTLATDFSDLVQYAGGSEAETAAVDGNPSGTLLGVSVDSAGKIVGTYTNGQTRSLAQVAVAHFANPQGLLRTGDNYFMDTENSGEAQIIPALGDPVLGTASGTWIRGSALEVSNVDTATEMIDMIAFQRAYQLNSRGISTADTMIKTAVDMKR